MGLETSNERAVDYLEVADPVLVALTEECLQPRKLSFLRCNDQLPASFVGNRVLDTEPIETLASVDAQTRLERVPRVVDTRVDHSAIVGAGLQTGSRLPLEQADRAAAFGHRAGRSEPDDAAPDHRYVYLFHV